MRKHKKLVIAAMMAAVLLFGSVVGVAFADDGSSRSVFQEKLAENLGITLEELQVKMAEVRGALPQRDGECWQGKQEGDRYYCNPFEELDEETQAALKEDLTQAREEMQAKITEIFESYGLDADALRSRCAQNAGNKLTFQHGFMRHRDRGEMYRFGGPPAPLE